MSEYIKEIHIIEIGSYEVIKKVNVSKKTYKQIEKIEKGININLNENKYFTEIVEFRY